MVVSLVLLQIITFAVIIGVLHFFFGSQLKVALNRLQVLHQESLEKEEVLNKELERAKVQCASEINRSKEEAKAILQKAKDDAEKLIRDSQERAHADGRKIIAEATEKSKYIEEEVRAGIDEKAIRLAQDLIRFTFAQEDLKMLHGQLIHELVDELGRIDKNKLAAVKADRAQVITSWALSPQEESHLKEVLFSKLGYALPIEEKVDSDLILGLVIKLGGVVVDGSLKNRLGKAVHAMRTKGA
jgi:F-type H+-transporting ATPase subunit b